MNSRPSVGPQSKTVNHDNYARLGPRALWRNTEGMFDFALSASDTPTLYRDLADAAGTTRSALAQWLIERVPVDHAGRPEGWEKDHPRDEELPINTG